MNPRGPLRTGVIHCEDNLRRMAEMPAESVDLIYLDPPFFSNRSYEVIWGDEAEVRSFEDRWEGGINVYINWMREHVIEMHRVLKPTGCLYLHCDWHANSYLRVMLDSISGPKRLQNEIAWCYRGGASRISDSDASTTRSASIPRPRTSSSSHVRPVDALDDPVLKLKGPQLM